MNEEEAIERCKNKIDNDKNYIDRCNPFSDLVQEVVLDNKAIKTILNLLEKKDKMINEALEIAFEYGQIDGEHHKTWVIDQIVKCLTGSEYNKWIAHYEYDEEAQEEYTWHKGIAP